MSKLLNFALAVLSAFIFQIGLKAQSAEELLKKVQAKYEQVNNYTAKGKMKTNVLFLKVPVADVIVYFKKPDLLKIKNEKGISFVPKGAVNISMGNVLGKEDFYTIDAGKDSTSGKAFRVIKLIPKNEKNEIKISTLYIDEKNLVVQKAETSTESNGTYKLEFTYGKYISYGLPDKVVFSFNVKDYKLPKGVTFDYEIKNETKPSEESQMKRKQGKVEISYSSYEINKGIDVSVFK